MSPIPNETNKPRSNINIGKYLFTDAPDHLLVISAQHGDNPAFNTLLQRHRQNAYNLAYRILYKPSGRLNAEQLADDIIQEASLRAWKYIKSCDPKRFRSWFKGIVRNECKRFFQEDFAKEVKYIDIFADIDSIESYGDWMISENPPHLPYVGTAAEEEVKIELEHVADEEMMEAVNKAVLYLSGKQKQVIFLRHKGYSYKEIAKLLKISASTARTHAERAYKNINQKAIGLLENSPKTGELDALKM